MFCKIIELIFLGLGGIRSRSKGKFTTLPGALVSSPSFQHVLWGNDGRWFLPLWFFHCHSVLQLLHLILYPRIYPSCWKFWGLWLRITKCIYGFVFNFWTGYYNTVLPRCAAREFAPAAIFTDLRAGGGSTRNRLLVRWMPQRRIRGPRTGLLNTSAKMASSAFSSSSESAAAKHVVSWVDRVTMAPSNTAETNRTSFDIIVSAGTVRVFLSHW